MAKAWTRDEVLIALNLYCKLPFGQLHQGNPEIIKVAELLGRTPGSVAMKLSNLASLDPAITQSGRRGLEGASTLDKAVWAEFMESPSKVLEESQGLSEELLGSDGADVHSVQEAAPEIAVSSDEETSAVVSVKVRRGQRLFRRMVLASYADTCCMSGLGVPQLLVASHIRPWHDDIGNRLNPRNGLCLSALHDRAYDQGYLSVRPDMTIAVSSVLADDPSSLSVNTLCVLEGKMIRLPEKFHPSQDLLHWHYETVFKK